MSPELRTRRDGNTRPRRHRSVQPYAVAWLALLWCLLWRDLSLANVLSGAALGVVVMLVFPLPPLRLSLRVHPWALVSLVGWLLADLVVASAAVARQTLRFGRVPRSAVIEVDLTTRSDLVLTVVAEITSLIPGSIVVEARRSTHTLFLHVLDADRGGIERARERTLAAEQRVVRAIGACVPEGDDR